MAKSGQRDKERPSTLIESVRFFFGGKSSVQNTPSRSPRASVSKNVGRVASVNSSAPDKAIQIPGSAAGSKRPSIDYGTSFEAGTHFHVVVGASLAELNHKLIREFEMVRKEDLLRMRHLEKQVLHCGGSIDTVDFRTNFCSSGDRTSKGASIEAGLDRERALERIRNGVAAGISSLTNDTLRLPSTSAPLQVQSAPGSARNSSLGLGRISHLDHRNQGSFASIGVLRPSDAMLESTSKCTSPKGPIFQPARPELVKPRGPDKAPPVLHEAPALVSHQGAIDINDSVKGMSPDYVGQTDIVTFDINHDCNNVAAVRSMDPSESNDDKGEAHAETVAFRPLTPQSLNAEGPAEKEQVASTEVVVAPAIHGILHVRNTESGESAVGEFHTQKHPESPVSHSRRVSIAHPGGVHERKSCRFNEAPVVNMMPVLPTSRSTEDEYFDSDDEDVDEQADGNIGRRVSSIGARQVRNSLEASRFQLLPIWLDAGTKLRRPVNLVGAQALPHLDDDSNSSHSSADFKGHHTEEIKQVLSMFVMQPNTGLRMVWDMIAALLIGYECVVLPLQYIDIEPSTWLVAAGWLVRLFWTVDLPLSFLTGYVLKDGTHELRPQYVMINYLKTWFILDIIMLVADWFEALVDSLQFAGGARSVKMLKTIRLCRMVRVVRFSRFKRFPQLFETLMESVFKPDVIPVVFSVIKIVSVFVWINHLMACIWVKIGEDKHGAMSWIVGHEFFGQPKDYIYSCAYHWSLQQFSGAAEVWPWNPTERNFAVATGVFTFVAAAGFVSSLTSSMTHFEIVTSQDSRRLAQLKHWLYECGISNTVAVRVQRNAQHALKEEKKNMPESSIELLPIISEPLRMEIHYDMHMQILATHAFFRLSNEVSSWMMRHVCHDATSTLTLSRGDMLFCDGEISQEPKMYFIKSGKLHYNHQTGRKDEATAGCWASEGGVWTLWTHVGGMLATSDCNLLVLEVPKYQSITGQFSKQREFGKQYGLLFVKHLNSSELAELTDLEDAEMDIEWLAMRSCPAVLKQSGLMAKIINKGGTRNSLNGLRGGGSVAFMAMSSVDRAIKHRGSTSSPPLERIASKESEDARHSGNRKAHFEIPR